MNFDRFHCQKKALIIHHFYLYLFSYINTCVYWESVSFEHVFFFRRFLSLFEPCSQTGDASLFLEPLFFHLFLLIYTIRPLKKKYLCMMEMVRGCVKINSSVIKGLTRYNWKMFASIKLVLYFIIYIFFSLGLFLDVRLITLLIYVLLLCYELYIYVFITVATFIGTTWLKLNYCSFWALWIE